MLNEGQVSMLRVLTQTAGWTDVLRPYIEFRADQLAQVLDLAPTERSAPYNALDDNLVRGARRAFKELLIWVDNQIKVADHNRALDELDRAEQANGSPARPQPTANPYVPSEPGVVRG